MKQIPLWKILVAVLAVLAVIFVIRLITGAIVVTEAALNTVLGIVVVVAALFIVIFMLTYARLNR